MLKKLATVGLLVFSLLATQVMAFAGELLGQTNFNDGVGLPWHTCESLPGKSEFSLKNGKYYITVINPGAAENRWDVQFRHRGLTIQSGHTYTVKFTVTASKDAKIYAKVGDQNDPYFEDWNLGNRSWQPQDLKAGQAWTCSETFTATRTADVCEFALHIGGKDVSAGTEFIFDDMSLSDPQFNPTAVPPTPSPKPIRVNQLGYYPGSGKVATLVTSSSSSQTWELKNSSGTTVADGKTKPFGADKDSGDSVQIIDFSDYTTPGKNYYLQVGQGTSFEFDIADDMYSELMYDSFRYFYYARSSVPIEMPYAKSSEWTRPAGHVSDIVACEKDPPAGWDPYSSSHTLDISGGWYDAGDHGKYVVNGGISVWTMQNQDERAKLIGDTDPYQDLNIPESSNSYPDVLDEARVHVECMIKLQVPAGNPRAGMAHHKGHDIRWTGLAVMPHQDELDRHLKPPTTAATLNLVAVCAQAYRLWKDLDPSFANKCLSTAETAWKAALANPAIYAPFDDAVGGGPYGDDYVEDDFYWAASEMLAATGDSEYLDYIKKSKWFLKLPSTLDSGEESDTPGSFNWGNTHSMGTLTLALVEPSALSASEIQTAKNNIIAASEDFIEMENNQGYGIPLKQCTISVSGLTLKGYPWGSNSFVMNNVIVMAYAYDFSKDIKHFNGAVSGVDYLFGRNPMDFVYVTGYGEMHAQYPHHRWFSHQVDPTFPMAPPGIAVGGPNSGLQDPWVKGSGWIPGEIPPQKAYMDHIESWSTNECTTNWNAPMAWIAGYMNEVGPTVSGGGSTPTTPPVGSGTLGDVNEDGSVNSTDYALVKRHILGTQELKGTGLANADVNEDGSVNSTDYALIKRFILGTISKF